MGCHFGLVRSVYIQSPQVAYVDLCLGNKLVSDEFKAHFFTGIHRPDFPDFLVKDCDVVFHPLVKELTSDRLYSFAIAFAEGKQLPGINLHYFYRNPYWNPTIRPKILTLPEIDDDLSL